MNLQSALVLAAMKGKTQLKVNLTEGEKLYYECKRVFNKPLQALYDDNNHWHHRKWALCFIERVLTHIRNSCEEMDRMNAGPK